MHINRIERVTSQLPQFAEAREAQARDDIAFVNALLQMHVDAINTAQDGFDSDFLDGLMTLHERALGVLHAGDRCDQYERDEFGERVDFHRESTLGSDLEYRPDPREDYLDQ